MKTNTSFTICWIAASAAALSSIGAIINVCITKQVKPIDQIIWCSACFIWIIMYILTAVKWKKSLDDYEDLERAYNSLDSQFDNLLKTTKEVNDNNIKQNKLAEDISKLNKNLIDDSNMLLAENKRLFRETCDLREALADENPKHPLIIEYLKKHAEPRDVIISK